MDDDGQMLLLGAVVLILGFFAIGALVARAPGFAEQAAVGNSDLLDLVDDLLHDAGGGSSLACAYQNSLPVNPSAVQNATAAARIEALYRSQGVAMDIDTDVAPLAVTVTDGRASIRFEMPTCS